MTADQILNGHLESDLRAGLNALKEACPGARSIQLVIALSANSEGYIGATVNLMNRTTFDCYIAPNIPEAVARVVREIQDPEAVNKQRAELEQKLSEIEKALAELPEAPEPERDEPVIYNRGELPARDCRTEHDKSL